MANNNHNNAATESVNSDSGVYFVLFGIGVILLALLPEQAAWINTSKGWYIQPRMGSALGLGILVLFSGVRVLQAIRKQSIRFSLNSAVLTLLGYRTALFSAALFLLYIQSLSIIGFTLSTLLFISTLLMLSRLFDRFWFLMAIVVTTALVLIFRVGLNVWLPEVWLYELFPAGLTDFANQYL